MEDYLRERAKLIKIPENQRESLVRQLRMAYDTSSNETNTFLNINRDKLLARVHNDGINLVGIMMSILKKGQYSQMFKVFVGNLKGDHPDTVVQEEDTLWVPITPSGKKDKASAGQQKPTVPVHHQAIVPLKGQKIQEEKEEDAKHMMKSFSMCLMSTKEVSTVIKPGDMVRLRNVVVKRNPKNVVVNGVPTTVMVDYINVEGLERMEAGSHAGAFYALLMHLDVDQPRIKRSEKTFVKGDASTKYGDEFIIFKVRREITDEDLLIANSALAAAELSTNKDDWARVDSAGGTTKTMGLRGQFIVHESWGDRFTINAQKHKKHCLNFDAYESSLTEFYIANAEQWAIFGPTLMRYMFYVVVATENVEVTGNLEANQTNKMGESSQEEQERKLFDSVLQVKVEAIYTDAPEQYLKIGIPVTSDFAQAKYAATRKMIPPNILKDYSDKNAHSWFTKPAIVCLNEFNGDPTTIWSDPSVKYVVLTNCVFESEECLDQVSKLTPEEGVEVIECHMANRKPDTKKMDPRHPYMRVRFNKLDKFEMYVFAIFTNRLFKTVNKATKMFLEGESVPKPHLMITDAPEDEDELENAREAQMQLDNQVTLPPQQQEPVQNLAKDIILDDRTQDEEPPKSQESKKAPKAHEPEAKHTTPTKVPEKRKVSSETEGKPKSSKVPEAKPVKKTKGGS
jgi:hypothetical protein